MKETICSCNCLTKTPDIKYHDKNCSYRLLLGAQEEFERFWLSVPDFDETLLNKDEYGVYVDDLILMGYYMFLKGIKFRK